MKKTLYKKEELHSAENDGIITLKYFLLETDLEIDNCTLKCYGIAIKKTEPSNGHNLSEMKQIANAFFNKSEALLFLEMLARNTVTPIALSGVLEDYIAEAVRSHNRIPVLV